MGELLAAIATLFAKLGFWILKPDPRCRCGHEKAGHLPTLLGKSSCEVAGCACKEYGEY